MPHRRQNFFNSLPDFEQQAIEEKMRAHAPVAPSFSLEDMEQARKESFDKGQEKGLQMAKDAIEQKTEILVQSMIDNIQIFEKNEIVRQADYIDNAVSIAYRATRKLLKTVLDAEKDTLIKRAIHDFMDDHTSKTALTLYVHPSMVQSVEKYTAMMSSTMVVNGDTALQDTQCRMEWVDGTFEFKPEAMVEQILTVMRPPNVETPDDNAVVDAPEKITHNNEIDNTALDPKDI
jgi:flagellar biosynthesis/type III secretory pathway protein FliH